jgi:nucleoside-diphosphate-sugar epimerase
MNVHTILGANGTISNELVPVLLSNNEKVRLVSRTPQPVEGVETFAADVTRYDDVLKAVQGSFVVYLLVGLEYKIKVWRESWPKIMTNVINACKATNCKLIFFDNVYMYGKVDGKMTEETPYNPCSKKGEVRAAIATQLLNEVKQGKLMALIARAPDFYGPSANKTSFANILIFEKLKDRKKAQWFINANVPHSFTYTPDAGKALYKLATSDEAFNQTWHLPTAANPLTGKEFIEQAAKAMNVPFGISVLPKWMLKLAGLFVSVVKESNEMTYQNEYSYVFDSSKYEKAFNFQPTSYEEGIRKTAQWYLNKE